MKTITRFFAALLFIGFAGVGSAAPISKFNVEWDQVGGNGTASATLSIDEALLANPGFNDDNGITAIFTDFLLSFGGTSAFAGTTFDRTEVDRIFLNLDPVAVDLTQELVGQAGFSSFGVESPFFNPAGVAVNWIGAQSTTKLLLAVDSTGASNAQEEYNLVSFRPVPVPPTLALLALGLLAIRQRIAA